jgi:predicted metalloprotease with PDZ domain
LGETDGRLTVRSLPADSPAYQWGLNTGDQIVAIDGHRAGQNFMQSYMNEKKPGDKVKLTIFRFDELKEMEITLGGKTQPNYRIVAVENPSDAQRQLYRGFLADELK